jgi:hypothetical protein
MPQLLPLKRFVVEITGEAHPDDPQGLQRAVKSWHNRLQTGSIPRSVIEKIGRSLFVDLAAWEEWRLSRRRPTQSTPRGKRRSDAALGQPKEGGSHDKA